MDNNSDKLQHNNIVQEIETSFLEYSMSVIVARALPDLRDGLKPVHRRILYDMLQNGLTPDKKHRKSATIVGDVMGHYHPHGDSSIYEAMVRMAQDFNYRYMLVDGHGNFGNIEGYGAAAYRYTEAKLAKISMELLRDINKNTVNFIPNYDESTTEPEVLPSRFPNILVNGTMGIAVGMATNIPPHNLGEVIDGCVAYIDKPDIDTAGLMQYVKGPDFPTGGVILGNKGIKSAYETGRGTVTIRSKATIEEKNGKNYIIVDEIPYGVNTLELKNKVADLVHNKIIDGISDYHTDLKNGVKITITLKKDANPQVVLNNLYKHTAFQSNFGIILLMLDNGVPRTLGLKDIISKYVEYQKEVIIRRTKFDLDQKKKRVHILEGLKIALDNIDEVIKIIRGAESDESAKGQLISRFGLSDAQTDAILEMKLRRLTALERGKIETDLAELLKTIADLEDILASEERIYDIIKNELLEIKNKYADERRTNIDMTAIDYIEDESLIPVDNIIVTLTNKGYIKRVLADNYKTQNRGGVGIKGMTTNEEDAVEHIISLKTHDYVLFFSNLGRIYRMKGYEIPIFSRQAKGLPIINLLPLFKGEKVTSMNFYSPEVDDGCANLVFATKSGIVKKTNIEEYNSIRTGGKIAINLKENDELIAVEKVSAGDQIILCASNGRVCRFNEDEIRLMGRTATGVKGMSLLDNDFLIGMETANSNSENKLLIVTENGYGKKTYIEEYRLTHRGSKGVKALNVTKKNGATAAILIVDDSVKLDLLIVTNSGMIIKIPNNQISTLKRNTQGVRLINLKNSQKVINITSTQTEDDDEDEKNREQEENV